MEHASLYYTTIINSPLTGLSAFSLNIIPLALGFIAFEWMNKEKSHPFDLETYPAWTRRSLYVLMIIAVFLFGYFGKEPFYYFQF
jgi:hypothetical protein